MSETRLPLEELNSRDLLWVVDELFDPGECRALVERIDASHPLLSRDGTPRATVRKNARVIVMDPGLADRVFEGIRSILPNPLVGMIPVAANECIRLYRYREGEFFRPHVDTHFQRSKHERSLLSVVVYLNEDFVGGETCFPERSCVVQPRCGRAAVFAHRMLHESRVIERGTKYAFRTDVMYRQT